MDYNNIPEAEESALWIRQSKSGQKYVSGIIKFGGQDIKFVAFPNQNKQEGDNKPSYKFVAKKPEIAPVDDFADKANKTFGL